MLSMLQPLTVILVSFVSILLLPEQLCSPSKHSSPDFIRKVWAPPSVHFKHRYKKYICNVSSNGWNSHKLSGTNNYLRQNQTQDFSSTASSRQELWLSPDDVMLLWVVLTAPSCLFFLQPHNSEATFMKLVMCLSCFGDVKCKNADWRNVRWEREEHGEDKDLNTSLEWEIIPSTLPLVPAVAGPPGLSSPCSLLWQAAETWGTWGAEGRGPWRGWSWKRWGCLGPNLWGNMQLLTHLQCSYTGQCWLWS